MTFAALGIVALVAFALKVCADERAHRRAWQAERVAFEREVERLGGDDWRAAA